MGDGPIAAQSIGKPPAVKRLRHCADPFGDGAGLDTQLHEIRVGRGCEALIPLWRAHRPCDGWRRRLRPWKAAFETSSAIAGSSRGATDAIAAFVASSEFLLVDGWHVSDRAFSPGRCSEVEQWRAIARTLRARGTYRASLPAKTGSPG